MGCKEEKKKLRFLEAGALIMMDPEV